MRQQQTASIPFSTALRDTFWLSLPLIMSLLANTGMEFVDTVMLGRLGTTALAAGALCGVIFSTVVIIGYGITSSVGALVANAVGAQDTQAQAAYVQQGLWLCVIISVIAWLIFWQTPLLLTLAAQSPEVVALATPFMRALMWSVLPMLVFFGLRELLAANNITRVILYTAMAGIPVNALLDYVLMFGKWGMPALGVAGAGIATTTTSFCMVVIIVMFIQRHPQLRQLNLFTPVFFSKPNGRILFELFSLGWPMGISRGFEVSLFSITSLMMGWIGTIALAAHQIALQCSIVTFMIPLGIAQATAMRVGRLVGAAEFQSAHQSNHAGIILGLIFSAFTALAFLFFPHALTLIYIDPHLPAHDQVAYYAARFLAIAALYQCVDAVQVVCNGALRGAKDTRIPMLLGLISYWGIGLSSGYLLAFHWHWQGRGLWWGLVLGLLAASILQYARFRWRIGQLIRGERRLLNAT